MYTIELRKWDPATLTMNRFDGTGEGLTAAILDAKKRAGKIYKSLGRFRHGIGTITSVTDRIKYVQFAHRLGNGSQSNLSDAFIVDIKSRE